MKLLNRNLLVLALAPMAAMTSQLAHATDPADAGAALATFSGTTLAYGPVLFGLAVAATGIMIGVAWIKKARGAAR
jgi:Mn2+/Fe2+ NRAMP family transporter